MATAASAQPNIFVRAWNAYENGLGSIVAFVSFRYGRLGAFTARRPWTVLFTSLVISLLICIGWARFRQETESDVLWVPQHGKAHDDKKFVEGLYPKSRPGASFYAQLRPELYNQFGGDDALQLPVTWEMFQLHAKVMALSVPDPNKADNTLTFLNLCYRGTDGQCNLDGGFLWHWLNNFTRFLDEVKGSASDPTVGNVTAFRARVSQTEYPDGQPVSVLSVYGGTSFTFNPFRLAKARVIAVDYTLDDSVDKDLAKEWHDKVIDLFKAELPVQQYMTFTYITGSSVGEELGKAINGDMSLVIISLLVFIVITIIVLSRWDAVRTRTTLAIAGIFVTALGLMSGWGWGMIFGMPFTPLQQLSPFILLGMGVDVVFILSKAYDIIMEREPWLEPPAAFARLMSTAGLSVQVTLLASAVAFALGSVDELNSVKWFSAYATLNTVMIMALMMTMFVAFMVITERRIAASRYDCLCCVTRSSAGGSPEPTALELAAATSPPAAQAMPPLSGDFSGRASSGSSADLKVAATAATHAVTGVRVALKDDELTNENLVKRFFRKYYAPFLAKWYVKVVVVLLFTAWAVASWYGIYQIKYGQPLSDLAPDGSYVQKYDEVQEDTYRQQVGEPVGLYFKGVDVSQPATQYKLYKSLEMVITSPKFNASTSSFLGNWLISFTLWAQDKGATVTQQVDNCYNPYRGRVIGDLASVKPVPVITGCVPQATFYTLLDEWLAEEGTNNNIIRGSNGRIVSCKLPVMQIASGDDDKYELRLMNSVREVEKDINNALFGGTDGTDGSYAAFIYGGSYVFNEGDQLLPKQALIFFILALVGVGVVTTFMLVNPVASLLMVLAVGLVALYLFGELWALHIRFNQVSVINMIMATGLAVDYSVYFAQKFMTVSADGTPNGRMQVALADTGSAVFVGGITALLGSVPMAFSKSVIIRTFFKLIFGTVLFSLLVGLILMPVLFSLLRPPPVRSVLVLDGPPYPPSSAQLPRAGSAGDVEARGEPVKPKGQA